jgi:alanine racemase
MTSSQKIPYYHPAWLEIDLGQFNKNVASIRKVIGKRKFCLPIKANAYGHGLVPMAEAAAKAGIDYLAVSCLQEGAQLREAGIRLPILVMGAIHEEQLRSLIDYELELSVSSAYKANLLSKVCEEGKKTCRIHIEVDTGMQRTGMRAETALVLIKNLSQNKYLDIVGVYSHFASSEYKNNITTLKQIEIFKNFSEAAQKLVKHKIIFHLANSGGLANYPESYFDMIRPGIMTFGYYSGDSNQDFLDIKPFLSLKAKISYFKVIDKNSGISYGHSYTSKESTRIVTIPVGYGDGYRRALSNRAQVLIRGKAYPAVGSVCMDQFMVDIGHDEAFVGEEAVLLGRQGHHEIKISEIASICDTIPYEILVGLNQRLPRRYIF